jgi:hypothetical protein
LRLSTSALDHHFLDICNGLSGVQSLRAGPGAVEDGMATVEPERVFEDVEPFACRFVAAVNKPAPSLEKRGRTQETFAVPPMAGAARGAAEAEDAFVVAVELAAFLRGAGAVPSRDLGSWSGAKVRSSHIAQRRA